MPSFGDCERAACGLAATKSIAVQSRSELRVISFLALWVIAPRLDRELRRPDAD
jgi:hypothetical protein